MKSLGAVLIPASLLLSLLAGCAAGTATTPAASSTTTSTTTTSTTTTSTTTTTTTTPPPVTGTPSAVPTCVTFIGDSITNFWPMTNFYAYDNGCYVNKGISGTNLAQILDGIDDKSLARDATVDPTTSHIVVIGGDAINSLNAGMSVADMENYYVLILAKLRGMGIQPILCTLLPTINLTYNTQIVALDDWIRATAAAQNIPLFDMYNQPGLVMPDGTLSLDHSADGYHIDTASYTPFTPYVEADIRLAAAKGI